MISCTRMAAMNRTLLLVAGAGVFLGVGALKLGHAGGGWFWVANMSAPWLLLAFSGGAQVCTRSRAIVSGMAVTLVALLAFYAAAGESIDVVASKEWRYIVGGAVTSPLFGALGFAWRQAGRRGRAFPVALLTGAFLAEPFAWFIFEGYLPQPWQIWVVEGAVGAVLALPLIFIRRQSLSLGGDPNGTRSSAP